jgi:hypothetical protein
MEAGCSEPFWNIKAALIRCVFPSSSHTLAFAKIYWKVTLLSALQFLLVISSAQAVLLTKARQDYQAMISYFTQRTVTFMFGPLLVMLIYAFGWDISAHTY